MQDIIQLRGITKTYKLESGLRQRQSLYALENIDLTLKRGEILGILGESGSGKSTLAKILTRLEKPDSGLLRLGEQVVTGAGRSRAERLAYGARVQMIFQDPFGSLNPVHTVGYHIQRPLRLHQSRLRLRADELELKTIEMLETVGLRPAASYVQKYPFELSGGQRQRVAIARALAVEPEILIADEPTSMLDVSIRMDILNLIKSLRDAHKLSIVLITHDLPSAWYVSDRVAVLYAGQVVETGRTEEILARPAHPYTRLLLRVAQQKILRSQGELRDDGHMAAQLRKTPGCLFASRCPIVQARCTSAGPELQALSESRSARCYYPYQEPLKERCDA